MKELILLLKEAHSDDLKLITHHSLGYEFDKGMNSYYYTNRLRFIVLSENLNHIDILSAIKGSGIICNQLTLSIL